MFVVPNVSEVAEYVASLEEVFGCRTCTISVEVPRGKRTSDAEAMLVDAGWDQVSSFTRWPPLRGADVASVVSTQVRVWLDRLQIRS